NFQVEKGGELLSKVGISSVDYSGAKQNLETENPEWDFDGVWNKAKLLWEDELNKIRVDGGSEDTKTIFYSALYHTLISPNIFSDVDGRYRGIDREIHTSDNGPTYTVF